MYGFVNLIKLFCAVDTAFLKIWKGRSSEHICSNTWLDQVQRKLDTSTSDITEAVEGQKLDILISRQWLHLLAWQVAVRYGIISPLSNGLIKDLHYPVQVARDVIQIASTVSQQSLDSHGIGMVSFCRFSHTIAYSLAGTEDCGHSWWSHRCLDMCGA
jgi:hypothetical protein